jgi:prolipoprotein diacylglyceryltransferase
MSANALILFFVGLAILKRRRYAGQVSLWSLVLYSITRFTIEGFRGDSIRGVWFGGALSTSQLVSVVTAVVASALLVKNRARVDAPPSTPANARA